jgi:exonuclease III
LKENREKRKEKKREKRKMSVRWIDEFVNTSLTNYDEGKMMKLYVPVTIKENKLLGYAFQSFDDANNFIKNSLSNFIVASVYINEGEEEKEYGQTIYALVDKKTNSFLGQVFFSKEDAFNVTGGDINNINSNIAIEHVKLL